MYDSTFSFMVFLPFFIFFFTHHVDSTIDEVKLDIKAASNSMVFQVYDPPPSCAYVSLLEAELARTTKALAQALKDCAPTKKKARKWFMIGDYFYKNITSWKPPRPLMPPRSLIHLSSNSDDSIDEFHRKLNEEVAKQKKGIKSKS